MILAYGLASYVIFFACFLYAVGFIIGKGVPTTLDKGTSSLGTPFALVINGGLLLLFALQHSVMARPVFKRWITRFIPRAAERSTYVLMSSLALVAMFIIWLSSGPQC